MRDDNYPDDIRDRGYDNDPRSPFYDNRDETWKADMAEKLVGEYREALRLMDWFEAKGRGYDHDAVVAEAVEAVNDFDTQLYRIAEAAADVLFDELRWDDRGNEQ
jgi:hypothetical protein